MPETKPSSPPVAAPSMGARPSRRGRPRWSGPDAPKLSRLTTAVPPETHDRLCQRAQQHGVTLSGYVRLLLTHRTAR